MECPPSLAAARYWSVAGPLLVRVYILYIAVSLECSNSLIKDLTYLSSIYATTIIILTIFATEDYKMLNIVNTSKFRGQD